MEVIFTLWLEGSLEINQAKFSGQEAVFQAKGIPCVNALREYNAGKNRKKQSLFKYMRAERKK